MNKVYKIITDIIFLLLGIFIAYQITINPFTESFEKLINKDIIINKNYDVINLTFKDNNGIIKKEVEIKDNNGFINLIVKNKSIPLFKDIGIVGSNFLSYNEKDGNYYIFGHNGPNNNYIGKWINDNIKINDKVTINTLNGNKITYEIRKKVFFNTKINKYRINDKYLDNLELKGKDNIVLFTCNHNNTNERIVIIGKPLNNLKQSKTNLNKLDINEISNKEQLKKILNDLKNKGYTNINVGKDKITFINKNNKEQTILINK